MVVKPQQRRDVDQTLTTGRLFRLDIGVRTLLALSNSATCVTVANPLRLRSLDKLAKAMLSTGPMNRND